MKKHSPSLQPAAGIAMRCCAMAVLLAGLVAGPVSAQNTSYNANSVPIVGSANVGIGSGVMTSNLTTATQNAALGYFAMNFNTSGSQNTAMGFRALYANTTGNSNTAVGYQSLTNNTASLCTGVGFKALISNTSGSNNTATGSFALQTNTTGNRNTANGVQALNVNSTGFENTAQGYQSANANTTGWGHVSVGAYALFTNTTGSYNSALGSYALINVSTGNGNTGLGHQGMWNATTGDYNTGLGISAALSAGTQTYSTAIGAFAISNASNKVRIGSTTVTAIEGQVAYTFPSDGRFKTNVRAEDVVGLEFIQRLRPVVYNFETRRFTEFLTQDMPDSMRAAYLERDFGPSTAVRQSGFIAQEVEQAAKEAGYNFDGVHVPAGPQENYSLAYSQFVVPLVKAVQEQQVMIQSQAAQLAAQQAQIDALTALVRAQAGDAGADTRQQAHPIEVFPNPSQGRFTVRFAPVDGGVIEVVDMLGSKVHSQALVAGQGDYRIDLSGLAKGSYLLRVQTSKGAVLASQQLILE